MKQCDFCFRHKEQLAPPYPKIPAVVCKACAYKVEQVIGFLEHYGGVITYQAQLETPPNPPKSKSKPVKFGDKPPTLTE